MSRAQAIVVRGREILMVRHRQGSKEWWCLPGGAILEGESPADAAVRELEEECRVRGQVIRETSVVTYGPSDAVSYPARSPNGGAEGANLRIIEHRRHTRRVKPGQHLSQQGVDLARKAGKGLAPFHLVVTSNLPRAYETAIAMGFAVDEQVAWLASLPEGFEDEVPWNAGIGRIAAAARSNPEGAVAQFARRLGEFHRELAARLSPNGRALVISHGGIVEASAVGCRPDEDYAAWGPAFSYCEGVRMYFRGTVCVRIEPIRVKVEG